MNKLNNKGFTLVELIGVMVILIVIAAIAVPNISSSVERNKVKKAEDANKALEYAIELYLSDNKNARKDFYDNKCYINITNKLVKNRYIMKEELNSTKNYALYSDGKIYLSYYSNIPSDKQHPCPVS